MLPLLEQFVSPVLQLYGDLFHVVGLFDGPVFNVPGILVAQLGIWQLPHGGAD